MVCKACGAEGLSFFSWIVSLQTNLDFVVSAACGESRGSRVNVDGKDLGAWRSIGSFGLVNRESRRGKWRNRWSWRLGKWEGQD